MLCQIYKVKTGRNWQLADRSPFIFIQIYSIKGSKSIQNVVIWRVFTYVTCTPQLITLKVLLCRRIAIWAVNDYLPYFFCQWLYSVIIVVGTKICEKENTIWQALVLITQECKLLGSTLKMFLHISFGS